MTEDTSLTFKDLNLSKKIVEALENQGFKKPTPIQAKAIPIIQEKNDLIALAATGSGKTAACVIPLCDRVDTSKKHIQVLVLVPTRELALQYASETQKIGNFRDVRVFALFGGTDMGLQISKLEDGVQVLIATPGRLIDCIYERIIDLAHVETFILDEADEMLSMGFFEDIEFLFQCMVHEHQTLLFSATMPPRIKQLSKQWLINPKEIQLTSERRSPANIDHTFIYCKANEKKQFFVDHFKKVEARKSIIFCHSRRETEEVYELLKKNKVKDVEYIHAGLEQNIRTSLIDKFRRAKIKHLIGTDVLARGMDFTGVTHVFIYKLSENADVYIHRAGRTGRYESEGTTLTFVTDREIYSFKKVRHFLKGNITWLNTPPPAFLENKGNNKTTKSKKPENSTSSTIKKKNTKPARPQKLNSKESKEKKSTKKSPGISKKNLSEVQKKRSLIPPPTTLVVSPKKKD